MKLPIPIVSAAFVFICFFPKLSAQDIYSPEKPLVKHCVYSQGYLNFGCYMFYDGGEFRQVDWTLQTSLGYAYHHGLIRYTGAFNLFGGPDHLFATTAGALGNFVEDRFYYGRQVNFGAEKIYPIYSSWSFVLSFNLSFTRLRGELNPDALNPPSLEPNIYEYFLTKQYFTGIRYDQISSGLNLEFHLVGMELPIYTSSAGGVIIYKVVIEYDF